MSQARLLVVLSILVGAVGGSLWSRNPDVNMRHEFKPENNLTANEFAEMLLQRLQELPTACRTGAQSDGTNLVGVVAISSRHTTECFHTGYGIRQLHRMSKGAKVTVAVPRNDVQRVCEHLERERAPAAVVVMDRDMEAGWNNEMIVVFPSAQENVVFEPKEGIALGLAAELAFAAEPARDMPGRGLAISPAQMEALK